MFQLVQNVLPKYIWHVMWSLMLSPSALYQLGCISMLSQGRSALSKANALLKVQLLDDNQ